ncbi:GH32 C-terminal domain-containing protein [Planctomycetaceae bacterium SH139]
MPQTQHLIVLVLAFTSSFAIAKERPDRIIADFEAASYEAWQTTGDAFGDAPASGTLDRQQAVSGFTGKGLVNSFRNGDASTGTLTSPEFTLDRQYLVFLIGGGSHAETCLQLIIEGEVIVRSSGMNDERLSLSSFDLKNYQGQRASLRIVDNERGDWGHVNVDQIVLSDSKPQTPSYQLRTREFTVENKYLILPIENGARETEVRLSVAGQPIRKYNVELATAEELVDFYAYFTIAAHAGQPAVINVAAATEDGFSLIQQADEVPGFEDLYDEPLRPQFHFSQKVGWNNDPNGMVYLDGEWHLYFQHNPVGWKWGNMTWGHAVSEDLIYWEQLPNVLFPHTMAKGACFSGGATIDKMNTSGWKTGDNEVLVAFFTDTELGECVAYSNDQGRTFTLYEGNPIIQHKGRDPKVIWYEYQADDTPLNAEAQSLGGHWVLFVYNEDPGLEQNTAFYTSLNLKDWTLQSRLNGFFECPELFELPVDGDPEETRWVTLAADAKYVIGDFDGREFTPAHEGKHQVHYGKYYASQTFDNAPEGRRIQIGWAQLTMPDMPFNQTFSFPHALTLRTTAAGIRMAAKPIDELGKLHAKKHVAEPQLITPDRPVSLNVAGATFEIQATFEVGAAKQFGINVAGTEIEYNAFNSELNGAALEPVDGLITLQILVDHPMIEICGNDGEVFITSDRRNSGNLETINAFVRGGAARLVKFQVFELKSIWP